MIGVNPAAEARQYEFALRKVNAKIAKVQKELENLLYKRRAFETNLANARAYAQPLKEVQMRLFGNGGVA